MNVHAYERGFLAVSGVLLFGCLAALLYVSATRGWHLPGHGDTVADPAAVARTPPFDQPGVRRTGPDSYEVVVIGRTWSFDPGEIRIPAGAEVTFVATSADVIHGLYVAGTRVNVMLIPGQVVRVRHRFRAPGEYLLICHEYCGVGHHTMGGKVVVE